MALQVLKMQHDKVKMPLLQDQLKAEQDRQGIPLSRPSSEFILHSIVALSPGIEDEGILTQWSKEENLMPDFYNSPLDAYSCKITHVVPVGGAPILVNRVTCKRQFFRSKRVQAVAPLFYPDWDSVVDFDPEESYVGVPPATPRFFRNWLNNVSLQHVSPQEIPMFALAMASRNSCICGRMEQLAFSGTVAL